MDLQMVKMQIFTALNGLSKWGINDTIMVWISIHFKQENRYLKLLELS